MNVTSVRTFFVDPGGGKNWLFVKVETDAGIHGWGECYTQADRDRAIEMHVQQLARYLVGRDPHQIKHFTFIAYNDFASKRGAMDFYCAVSGIEQALWDIVGKALHTPVYNLLGGACRDKIRVYANGWGGRTPEEMAERARQLVEQGFSAMKFDPFAEVRRAIALPVVTGEELYTKAEFREVFEKQAADILNPDVCNCGGILELKEIAAMAEPYFVAMAPHNYNSTTIGLAATLQLCAVIPNFLITEYFVNFTARGDEISIDPLRVENGYIKLPTAPGLGLDLDEAAMARYPYREHAPRGLRQYHEEGP